MSQIEIRLYSSTPDGGSTTSSRDETHQSDYENHQLFAEMFNATEPSRLRPERMASKAWPQRHGLKGMASEPQG